MTSEFLRPGKLNEPCSISSIAWLSRARETVRLGTGLNSHCTAGKAYLEDFCRITFPEDTPDTMERFVSNRLIRSNRPTCAPQLLQLGGSTSRHLDVDPSVLKSTAIACLRKIFRTDCLNNPHGKTPEGPSRISVPAFLGLPK